MKTHNPLGVLGVTLAVTLIMSGVPAQAQQFDSDPHPLDVRESGPTLTHEDAAHLARQLDPVRLRVHEKDTPQLTPDPYFATHRGNDEWRSSHYSRAKNYRPGEIIRSRSSVVAHVLFRFGHATQFMVKSLDSRGYPVEVTATLVVPLRMKENASVFTWVQFTNSSGADCDPTTELHDGKYERTWQSSTGMLFGIVDAGRPVLLIDVLGPNHAYPMNRGSSHYVLDAMRAVHHFPHLQQSHFVVAGISHGGLVTSYTAAEQPYYAPDLTKYIDQFVIEEGAPDLLRLAAQFGVYGKLSQLPSPYAALAINFLIGAIREYPDKLTNIKHWLTPEGMKLMTLNADACQPASAIVGALSPMPLLLKPGFYKSVTFHNLLQIAKEQSSYYYPGSPAVPVFLTHGSVDGILPQASDDQLLYEKWCNAGTNAVYVRVPFTGHILTPAVTVPRAYYYGLAPLITGSSVQTSHCGHRDFF